MWRRYLSLGRGSGSFGWWRRRRRRSWMGLVGGGVGRGVDIVVVVFVVARYIAWLLGPLHLSAELGNDAALNHLAALRVDWMSDISVKLGAALCVADGPLFTQASAALIAILGLE